MKAVKGPVRTVGTGWNVQVILLLALCVMVPCPYSVAAPEDLPPSEQAREILEEGDFQRDPPDIGATGQRSGEEAGDTSGSEGNQSGEDAMVGMEYLGWLRYLGAVLNVLMWVAIVLVIGGAGYILFRAFQSETEDADEPPGPETGDDPAVTAQSLDADEMQRTLADADELARDGRYTDAIRRMFLDAVDRIERELDVPLAMSETNHEYLDRIRETDVRHLCEKLVLAVDRFYYGGETCAEADYRDCRRIWKKVQNRARS